MGWSEIKSVVRDFYRGRKNVYYSAFDSNMPPQQEPIGGRVFHWDGRSLIVSNSFSLDRDLLGYFAAADLENLTASLHETSFGRALVDASQLRLSVEIAGNEPQIDAVLGALSEMEDRLYAELLRRVEKAQIDPAKARARVYLENDKDESYILAVGSETFFLGYGPQPRTTGQWVQDLRKADALWALPYKEFVDRELSRLGSP